MWAQKGLRRYSMKSVKQLLEAKSGAVHSVRPDAKVIDALRLMADKNMPKLIETLGARGLQLAWCEHLGDDPELITATLRRTFAGGEPVFSFGGIGATPDDHTRLCAALAAGVTLKLHPGAESEIR